VRLLADENFDRTVIQALRHSGHDVRAIGETNAAAPDELVIEIARNEGRVLLTEDKDFGDLVYNRAQPSAGVILFRRFARMSRDAKSRTVVEAVEELGQSVAGKFVVVEPGRIRIGGDLPS
jgi:predicted nuclease of predicted toxin-antitoxin system